MTYPEIRYILGGMIKSFACKDTKKLFNDLRVKRFDGIKDKGRVKLGLVEDAISLRDLEIPPGNKLEALSGNRIGQHSIRINKQWRVCFKWIDGHAFDVEIVDYH